MYWGALAILYLVLAIQTRRWHRRVLSATGGGDVRIKGGSLRVLGPEDEPENVTVSGMGLFRSPDDQEGGSVSVLGLLQSLLRTDSVGFGLACLGALLTALGI